MSAMSDFLENELIDHIFRGAAYTLPSSLYVALFTTAPSDAAGGTEVTGGSYARAAVACSLTNWSGTQGAGTTAASSGTTGTTSNNVVISFATPTASWGNVTHFGIFTAATAGSLLFSGALTTAKTINTGDIVQFPVGSLSFTLD